MAAHVSAFNCFNKIKENKMSDVFIAAKGHYEALLREFFPQCEGMLNAKGRHVPDPFRGGSKDGARVDKRFNETGRMFFNQNIWGLSGPCVTFYQLMLATGVAKDQRDFFCKVGSFLHLPEYEKGYHETPFERKLREERDRIFRREQERKARNEMIKASILATAKNREMLKNTVSLFGSNGEPNPVAHEVWSYFKNRGLEGLNMVNPSSLKNLRCAVQLEYFGEGHTLMRYDSLVCRVQTDKNEGVQLHRTYLYNGKKARVQCPKKLTASDERLESKCSFIKIGAPKYGVIGIAEGVETALSVYLATGLGCYCCVCAQNIKNFELPQGCTTVVVFADKDSNGVGLSAAQELVNKYKDKPNADCFYVLPKQDIPVNAKGIDWNDVLQMYGKQAFPTLQGIVNYAYNRLSRKRSSAC